MTPTEQVDQMMRDANKLPPDALARLGLMVATELPPAANHAEVITRECAARFIAFMTGNRPEVPK